MFYYGISSRPYWYWNGSIIWYFTRYYVIYISRDGYLDGIVSHAVAAKGPSCDPGARLSSGCMNSTFRVDVINAVKVMAVGGHVGDE